MLTRGLKTALVVVLLVTSGGVVRTDAAVDQVQARVAAKAKKARCSGISHRQVRGLEPTYTRKKLGRFPNRDKICHGIWLPRPRRHFVPQGIAIAGDNTAWISGFRHREGYGKRPCRLMRVGLTTGRRVDFHPSIYGRVGQRPRTYCRHGGGILQRAGMLWIVESSKLWLVEPNQSGRILNARRAWRLESPVRGSAVVATASRIGMVPFQKRGPAHIHWFSFKRLMRPGVLDLAVRPQGRKQIGAVARTRVPTYVQGATMASGRLFLARSTLACGELVTPTGKRIALVPGAEGIQFSSGNRRLWAVSESGAVPYVRSRKPLTAGISSFGWGRLGKGTASKCRFRAR